MHVYRMFLGILLSAIILGPAPGEAQTPALAAQHIREEIPLDPSAPLWAQAPAVNVPLLAQVIARPLHFNPSITALEVRALHNGAEIGFLLTWKDRTKDVTLITDIFRDAVAVQVPVKGEAPITMGAPENRVLILHWKADWQADIDGGFVDIGALYPNFWIDWYPFVPEEHPYDIRFWTNPEARRYLTGWVLGNPRSQPEKRTPVEEQIAEGFGSLTTNLTQRARGKGVYADGEWRVVITRPFVTGDPNDPAWGPGQDTQVAFAAWDGANREIGARKSFSAWLTLKLAPTGR